MTGPLVHFGRYPAWIQNCEMADRRIPNFRWRILPAFVLIGLTCFVGVGFYNNVILAGIPITHPAHFLIFVSALIWVAGALLFFAGKWRWAIAATALGFLLPFFRDI